MKLNIYRANPMSTNFHDVNRGDAIPTAEFFDKNPAPGMRIKTPDNVPGGSWDPNLRPIKEWTRHLVARAVTGKKKRKLLVLPSYTGRDIDVLKYHGVVDSNAEWVCVECEHTVSNYFQRKAEETQLFEPGMRVEYFTKYLHQYINSQEPFDFAWVDLFGNIRWTELEYFCSNRHFTMRNMRGEVPDIDIFFTFGYRNAFRGYGDICLKVVKNLITDFGDSKHPGLAAKFNIKEQILEEYRNVRNAWQEYEAQPCDVGPHDSFSRSCYMDDVIVTQIQLLKHIFIGYHGLDFTLDCYVYHDEGHHEMVLFHLSDFTPIQDDTEYFGRFAIDMMYQMGRCISDSSNEDIAKQINKYAKESKEEVNLTAEDIARWRKNNGIAHPEAMQAFNMAVQLDANLYVQIPEEDDPPKEQWVSILKSRLNLFNPWIEDFEGVKISELKNGLKISTPSSRTIFDFKSYTIRVGPETKFESENDITVSAQYLARDNRSALFSVFRLLFIGDPHLHPQLINTIDPELFTLSEPQVLAVDSWVNRWNRGERAGVIIMPTGMGKTTVSINIVRRFLNPDNYPSENIRPSVCDDRPCRMLFLSHRAEILDQTILRYSLDPKDKDPVFSPQDIGVAYSDTYNSQVKALQRSRGSWRTDRMSQLNAPAVFSTVDSLRTCLHMLDPSHFDLIIVDEAHHDTAATWTDILTHFNTDVPGIGPKYVLGLTATPFRSDEANILRLFGYNEVYRLGFKRGFFMGYLSWPEYTRFPAPRKRKKKGVRVRFDPDEKRVHQARAWKKNAGDLKTVGFCSSVIETQKWARYMKRAYNIRAEALHKDTSKDDRESFRKRFELPVNHPNSIQILFVKDLFNEGVDIPDIEAILILRRTKSPVKHFQQLGRGLRLAVGKRSVKILDFESNYPDDQALLDVAIFLDVVKRGRGGGGGGGGIGPPPTEEMIIPYRIDRRGIRVTAQNALKKAEKQQERLLLNRLYDYRIRQRMRYADIKQQPEFVGERNVRLAGWIRQTDSESPDSRRDSILKKIQMIHTLIVGYQHIGMSTDQIFERINDKAKVTRNVFDEILSCVEEGLAVPECANKIIKPSTRGRRRRNPENIDLLRLLVSRIAGSDSPDSWEQSLVGSYTALSLLSSFVGQDLSTEQLHKIDAFSNLFIQLLDRVRGSADIEEDLVPGINALNLIESFLQPSQDKMAEIVLTLRKSKPIVKPPETRRSRGRYYKQGDAEARETFFELCLDHLIEKGKIRSNDLAPLAAEWGIGYYQDPPDATTSQKHIVRNRRYQILQRLVKEAYAEPDLTTSPRRRVYKWTKKPKDVAQYGVSKYPTSKPKKKAKKRKITKPKAAQTKPQGAVVPPPPSMPFEPTYTYEPYVAPSKKQEELDPSRPLAGWTLKRRPRVAIVGGRQLNRNIKGHRAWLEGHFDVIYVPVKSRSITPAVKQIANFNPDLTVILAAFVSNDAISAIIKKLPTAALTVVRHLQKDLRSIAMSITAVRERGEAPWFVDAHSRSQRTNPWLANWWY